MLYLAYGSNLNMDQMAGRCPYATPLGRVDLPGYRLVFRGVADIEPGEGMVPCGLWEVTDHCLKALDRYEGVKGGLYRRETIRLPDGREALTYRMNDEGYYDPPSIGYVETIVAGYEDFGIEVEHLIAAVDRAWQMADDVAEDECEETEDA